MLDISRIESGEFKIVSQSVKLPELFDFYCQAIAGMNAHLSKPINIDRAVRTIIECARTAKEKG